MTFIINMESSFLLGRGLAEKANRLSIGAASSSGRRRAAVVMFPERL
jgi:hypothetical protein